MVLCPQSGRAERTSVAHTPGRNRRRTVPDPGPNAEGTAVTRRSCRGSVMSRVVDQFGPDHQIKEYGMHPCGDER